MNKVKYFFVGIGKCGTSWIYETLKKHEVVSVPNIKEPYLLDLEERERGSVIQKIYLSQNDMADFSNTYYWDPENPVKIFEHNPSAKVVITVRMPSQRIKSHFFFLQRSGYHVDHSLYEYLTLGDDYHLIKRSQYWGLTKRYQDVLGGENVLLLPLELLKLDPQQYIEVLCKFLNKPSPLLVEEDKRSILPRSKARNPRVVKIVLHCAKLLRRWKLLGILGRLKSSRIINKLLFTKAINMDDKLEGLGIYDNQLSQMDDEYKNRITELYPQLKNHFQNEIACQGSIAMSSTPK